MSLIKKILNFFVRHDTDINKNAARGNGEDFIVEPKVDISSHSPNGYGNSSDSGELSPVEILMLDYADGWIVGKTSFPGYWHYQYNSDPKKLIERLLSLDLLKIDSSLHNNMKDYLLKDLKELLRVNELKVSGNKDELIKRLLDNIPKEELKMIFNQKKYLVTEKGKEILALNDHIKFFHSYSSLGISIYRAQAIKKENPDFNKFHIAHKQLEFSSTRNLNNGDWGLYRNDRHSISVILELENKLIESLEVLFEVCYYDLSGTSNNFNLDFVSIYEEYFFPYENSHHTVAPGVIAKMQDLQDRLAISKEEFLDIGLNRIEKIKTPIHLFTHNEFLKIISCEMNNEKDQVSAIYSKAQTRYHKKGRKTLLGIQQN